MNNETELTNLLSDIRAKRDLKDFVVEVPAKNKKKGQLNTEKATLPQPNIVAEPTITPSVITSIETPVRVNQKKYLNPTDFLAKVQLAENSFSFQHNRRYYLDDKIFQTLALLKLSGKIRNISTLVNVILAQFLEENEKDIERLLKDLNL